MKVTKSRTQATPSARRIVYQQGKRKVVLEQLDDAVAVRCRAGAEATVCARLRSLGRVRAVESQQLLIGELPDATQRAEALKQLQQWVEEGKVEFVTPVLRDMESQLNQILTDEITVRLKSEVSPERLRRLGEKYGVTVVRQNEFVPNQFIVKVAEPSGMHTLEVASQLDAADEVLFASPNFISEFRR
jgi:hypothetical protein